MAEGGLVGLTVEGTAARAGVAKTTVYRRYPSKLDLAIAAVAELINTSAPHVGDDEADDALGQFSHSMGSAAAQAAMLAVAAAAATNPEVHERFQTYVLTPALERSQAHLDELIAAGKISPGIDSDFYYDVIVGTLLHRLVIRRVEADAGFHDNLEQIMAFLLSGMAGR